ncbi:MAG: HD domain-containing protein, partial [Candidatus Methanomethylophilus sp.]|nr:HD domain-containing protein [Methanomethylophilus sp.]
DMICREFSSAGIMQKSEHLRELLLYAARLHDIGAFINYERHNVFSYAIIKNSYLAGFDSAELEWMALLTRFHHGSFPNAGSRFLLDMDRRSVPDFLKYAMILKIADILDRGRDGAVDEVRAELLNGTVNLTVTTLSDLSLVEWKLSAIAKDFETAFGSRLNVEYLRV